MMSRAFDWVVTCRLYVRWVLESEMASQPRTPWIRKAGPRCHSSGDSTPRPPGYEGVSGLVHF